MFRGKMSPQASESKIKVNMKPTKGGSKPSTCYLLVLDNLGSIPDRCKGWFSLLKLPNRRLNPHSLLLIGYRGIFLQFSGGTEENNVPPE
jgi:hypothetical protein